MEALYLPQRSRKTLQQINQSESDGEDRKGKKKRKHNEESSSSGEEGSDEERPKKRGRPPLGNRERIKGFTDAELRRFVKSYKKFPAPLKRLDAVACDAELQEKPLAELKKLGELLRERCLVYMGEHTASKENNESNSQEDSNMSTTRGSGRKRVRGPSFKLGGVSVNAKTMMACEQELAPLDDLLPTNSEERLKWVMDCRTKPAHFDVEWTNVDDSRLLIGIYQYGMGSWEQMKMDPSLEISDKILANEDKKPQAKHLQTRAEYLLKILKKNMDLKKGVTKPKRQRKIKEGRALTKEIIENEEASSGEDANRHVETHVHNQSVNSSAKRRPEPVKQSSSSTKSKDRSDDEQEPEEAVEHRERREKKKSKKQKSSKKEVGPMHFTANNEPRALEMLGDLDPVIFNECKEKMRPVKKALKALDNPDQSLSEQEQVNHTRMCLIQIGEQINVCLSEYTDPDKIKEWRSNLWYFVSKFTEFDAKKLYKLYKHAAKMTDKGSGTGDKDVEKKQKSSKKNRDDEHKQSSSASVSNSKEHKHDSNNKRRHEDDSEREEREVKKSHSDR